jgi:methionyl-tRNA synthetase
MTIDEFLKVELKTAKVMEAVRVEGSDKLLKLTLDAGDKDAAGTSVTRQILAGIGKAYEPADLTGKTIVIVANLDPRQMMGETSNGMLLAATDGEGKPRVATIDGAVEPGTQLR